MKTELVLGYDAKEMWLPRERHWSEWRVANSLIRPEAARPLSTDGAVWLNVFEAAMEGDLPRRTMLRMQRELRRRGDAGWLWSDLRDLNDACCRWTDTLPRPFWLVAVTVVAELGLQDYLDSTPPDERMISPTPARPEALEPGWRLLGYDVSDCSGLSGLSNCLFTSEEDRRAADPFHDGLNDFHLFTSREAADAFRLHSNERVPEHAPFLVYGLYRVQAVE